MLIYQNWQRTTGVSPWVNVKAKIGKFLFKVPRA